MTSHSFQSPCQNKVLHSSARQNPQSLLPISTCDPAPKASQLANSPLPSGLTNRHMRPLLRQLKPTMQTQWIGCHLNNHFNRRRMRETFSTGIPLLLLCFRGNCLQLLSPHHGNYELGNRNQVQLSWTTSRIPFITPQFFNRRRT